MMSAAIFPAPDSDRLTLVISRNVRILMAERGVSQMQLAAAMHLSQTVISKRLNGHTPWDAVDMDKLRRIFGVSAAELVTALPRLDSNQQPAALAEREVAPVISLWEKRSGGAHCLAAQL